MPKLLEAILPVITAVVVAPVPLSAQECEDPRTFADAFVTAGFGTRIQDDAFGAGSESKVSIGLSAPAGCGGRWTPRADLSLGLRSSRTSIFGSLFGGLQLAVGRVLPSPLIRVGETTRAEPYLLVGGGGYVVRDLPEAPGERSLLSNATVGLGVRVSAMEGAASPILLEVVREERFGPWTSRWYLQWAFAPWSL